MAFAVPIVSYITQKPSEECGVEACANLAKLRASILTVAEFFLVGCASARVRSDCPVGAGHAFPEGSLEDRTSPGIPTVGIRTLQLRVWGA